MFAVEGSNGLQPKAGEVISPYYMCSTEFIKGWMANESGKNELTSEIPE